MNTHRMHGQLPFNIAVIHGGPGARGEMYPVARELSSEWGVLEPLQSEKSVEGQVEELKNVLENFGCPPLVLIGFSWGAWLSYIFTAQYPSLVKKLVLVSSGPFEDKYAASILDTRLSRLGAVEKAEALSLITALNSHTLHKDGFVRFGELMGKADSFDSLRPDSDIPQESPDIAVFQAVWEQASHMRTTSQLLQLGERIQCPVVAIHGDYDPHPAAGVNGPLSRVLKDFRFVLLPHCGHHPWLERHAKEAFFQFLKDEIW
jgi:pimeloyl-ACP methyl ester carboxylesterase